MSEKSIIYFLYFMFCLSYSQDINYEEACTNMVFRSKKDCSVAPWEENRRCCYISYNENGVSKGECAFLNDTKSYLKAIKTRYENDGKSNVKIECDSHNLKIYYYMIIFLLFYFLI